MKTCVKFENGKFWNFTKLVTIEKAVMKDTPTVNNEISGTIGDLNTITNTIKIKMTVITSVFFIPSWIEFEKEFCKTSAPVT